MHLADVSFTIGFAGRDQRKNILGESEMRRCLKGLFIAGLILLLPLIAFARTGSSKNLGAIADDYYWVLQDRLLRPNISKRGNTAWVAKLKKLENRLAHIKTSKLDQQARMTHSMLSHELKQQREYISRGWITEDINGTESLMHTLVGAIDASERKTINDWKWTIKTLKGSSKFMKAYVGLLQQGVATGRARSRKVTLSSIEGLDALTSRNQRKNPFLALMREMDTALDGKKQLPAMRRELKAVLYDSVLPAHRNLRTFLKKTYLPKASKLGTNRERYLYHMAEHLGPNHRSPEDLARWGKSEVNRLTRDLKKTMVKIDPKAKSLNKFMGSLNRKKSNRYATGEDLINATKNELGRAEALARKLAPVPRTKVNIKRVPKYQEGTVAAQYMPTGEREGEMQVNTGKLLKGQRRYDMATLVTHEVYGGHHLAAMYAYKQTGLSSYRQNAAITTYDEGWALYTEQWRADRGEFTPHERVGFIVNHLWRAARLVVDTGLHTGTMTKREAIEYFQKTTFTSRTNATAEIERYMNWPGQALSYYVGKRLILKTRGEVKKILGKNYDARKFHAKLLSMGSVPPRELHGVMLSWARRRAGQLERPRIAKSTQQKAARHRASRTRQAPRKRPPRRSRLRLATGPYAR